MKVIGIYIYIVVALHALNYTNFTFKSQSRGLVAEITSFFKQAKGEQKTEL